MFNYQLNSDGASYAVSEITDFSVTRVVIPDTYNGLPVTEISADFSNCEKLQEFVLGNNVSNTGYGTFDLPSIERVYLGKSVQTFCGPLVLAEKLKDIYYSGTEEEWNRMNFVFADDSISVLENAQKHFGVMGKACMLSFGEEKLFPYTHWNCIKGKPTTIDSGLIEKLLSDIDYVAMMCDVELEEDEDE